MLHYIIIRQPQPSLVIMLKKYIPFNISSAAKEIGENCASWRKMYDITQAELAERCRVSRETISRLENGDGSVSFYTVLEVVQKFGILDKVQESTNPYNTRFGIARADRALGERVVHKRNGN